MKVSGVARFERAGKVHMVPKRGNTEWATLVGEIGRKHAPAVPWQGGVSMSVVFWMPRPATLKKTVMLPLKRPDIDNLTSKLSDQFNGVFYADDSQIVDFIVRKLLHDGRAPRRRDLRRAGLPARDRRAPAAEPHPTATKCRTHERRDADMAYPLIATTAASATAADSTSHICALPAGIAVGDLLLEERVLGEGLVAEVRRVRIGGCPGRGRA